MRFPVQIMKHERFDGENKVDVSFDISLAGTTIEGVSQEDARTLVKVLQVLIETKKEVSHE